MEYYLFAILAASACLTVIIEVIVLFILKVRDLRLLISIPLNIGTNVFLNAVLSWQANTGWLLYSRIFIFEVLIFLFETFVYQLINKDKKNCLYSLLANLASLAIGSVLIYVIFEVVL